MWIEREMVLDTSFKSLSEWLAVILLSASLALGGATGQGFWSDAIVQLTSLLMLVLVALLAPRRLLSEAGAWPLCIAVVIVGVPLAQLAPLPPSIWSVLPGRPIIYESFRQAAIEPPWLPLSLSPEKTLRSCLALAPPIAIFVAATLFGPAARRAMAATVLAFVGLNILLGVAQVAGGPSSALRFYSITNIDRAVGFFANRNHYSALLYGAAPIFGAWGIWRARNGGDGPLNSVFLWGTLYVLLMFGLMSAGSRAGMLLAILAGLGIVALARKESKGFDTFAPMFALVRNAPVVLRTALIAAASGAVLFGGAAWVYKNSAKLGLHDARIDIFHTAWSAAIAYAPVGAGFGAFAAVYQMFEDPRLLSTEFINRAHSDWLELWLEGGVSSVATGSGFFLWFVVAAGRVWREAEGNAADFDPILARASTIVIALLAIHSLVDYPLRTTAMACVLALACGNLASFRSVDPKSVTAIELGREVRMRGMRRERQETLPGAQA